MVWPPFFEFTKQFPENTKENMPAGNFCSHLTQEGQIDLIPLPECCIFIAVSEDDNIDAILGHIYNMAKWSCDQNMAI